jgi:HAE1 family hydrophobic/amphiphilic exporter-1
MFFLILTLLGIISASRMAIDLYPEITYPVINISTSYSGAGPEEVEQLVTIPIERTVSTINNVRSITSVSSEGFSRVSVYFDWGTNLETALDAIRANLDRVKRRLPEDADTPSIFQYDPSAEPVMTIGLSGHMSPALLKELAEEEVAYYLQRADGVAAVDIRGGQSREVLVALHRDRLAALGVTINQVASAIGSENTLQPAGVLETGTAELTLRTHGQIAEIEEIRNIIVATRNGIPVYLRDLGTVEERARGYESIVRIDGIPGIVLSVQKQSGSNTVAVANNIYQVISELRQRYSDLNIRVLNDTSTFIRDSVTNVSNAAILGACLAGLVLFFFLHNIRATMIASAVMPISILATLILAYWGKMTLNSISLGGLALGVGMLVDNTVVVIDNISRKLENPELLPAEAALEGTKEITPAVSASTLTTVCVFFPLVYITGQTGIIFSQLSYMVIFSLLCSLLVAVTLTPMLSARYFKNNNNNGDTEKPRNGFAAFSARLQEQWTRSYQRFLSKCLQRKGLVITACLFIFAATLLLWPLIGTELIPETDEGIINIRFNLPPGVKLDEADMVARQFEEIITALPELENYEITVGSGRGSSNRGSITLRLSDPGKRRRTTMDVVRDLQTKLVYPGARIRIFARNSMRMLYSGASTAVAIDIRGYNQDLARDTAKLIIDRLNRVPGVSNIDLSREEETPEFAIKINRKRAGDLGISAAQIGTAINYAISGRTATTLRREGEELPVRVTLREEDISSVEDLKQILVSGRNNRLFPLSSLVEVELANRPVSIERKDRERNITVTADLDRGDLSAAMQDIRAAMAGLNLPRGITLHYSGDFEEQQRSFNELKWALILALLLVYMVMASQFESLLDPFIIMFSVPFALSGVLLILFLTDTPFNTQVYIGLIILGGVVVNNAIVLVSYFRLLLQRGLPLQEAVITAGAARLRPILMTTITTVLGLVPLALETGSGANLQAPMARAVIGGLIFASFITLALIPVIFVGVENILTRLRQRFATRTRRGRSEGSGGSSRDLAKTGTLLLLLLTFGFCTQAVLAEAGTAPTLKITPAGVEAAPTLESTPTEADTATLKITLSGALALAWENSEDGKIIAAKKESFYSSYRQTTGEKALKVYTEAGVTDLLQPDNAGAIELIMEKTLPVANIFGAKSYSDLLAGFNLEINLLALESQKTALISRVITAYQSLLSAGRDLELAEENYHRAVRFYEEIMVKAKVGLTSIIDETGAEVQVANAQTGLDRAIHRYHLAKFDLCRLLGVDETVDLILAPLETAGCEEDLEALIAAARENRPELRQAGLELSRAETLHELAKLTQNLGVGLNWSFQGENYRTGVSLSNQARDGNTGEWNLRGNAGVSLYRTHAYDQNQSGQAGNNRLELVLRWTLTDGRVRREQVKQASLLISQREEEEKKTLKNIEYEVKEAYYNYKDLESRISSSALQLEYNRVYLDAAEAKFRSGLASAKEVLEAQLLLNEAEVQYEQVKSNLYLAYVKLLAATGRLSMESFTLEAPESQESLGSPGS